MLTGMVSLLQTGERPGPAPDPGGLRLHAQSASVKADAGANLILANLAR
jgi:hypothetical protein